MERLVRLQERARARALLAMLSLIWCQNHAMSSASALPESCTQRPLEPGASALLSARFPTITVLQCLSCPAAQAGSLPLPGCSSLIIAVSATLQLRSVGAAAAAAQGRRGCDNEGDVPAAGRLPDGRSSRAWRRGLDYWRPPARGSGSARGLGSGGGDRPQGLCVAVLHGRYGSFRPSFRRRVQSFP